MVMDISARMAEANPHLPNPNKSEALIMIDEIDLHLHPRWQQSILKDLQKAFPNVQFIVTTHSPFVLSSIENSVIYDLEKQFRGEDLSGYSYDGLIENYFNLDKYSQILKDKLNNYKKLIAKKNLTEDEEDSLEEFEEEFEKIPNSFALEFVAEFQKIQLQKLTND